MKKKLLLILFSFVLVGCSNADVLDTEAGLQITQSEFDKETTEVLESTEKESMTEEW